MAKRMTRRIDGTDPDERLVIDLRACCPVCLQPSRPALLDPTNPVVCAECAIAHRRELPDQPED